MAEIKENLSTIVLKRDMMIEVDRIDETCRKLD